MISLAGRDIFHSWGKFVFTGFGLGLLIGVTLIMAGVYRGMVDDAKALLNNSGADLWVVQQDTLGPYAEPSSVRDDLYRSVMTTPEVEHASNITYLTTQVHYKDKDIRAMVVGIHTGEHAWNNLGWPPYLLAGRQLTRGHYEAVVDITSGLKLGDRIKIRRNYFTVVGLTRRMVSSGGDPMIFIPLKDAQQAQFQKDNAAILQDRPQTSNRYVNAILVRLKTGTSAEDTAEHIQRWQQLTVYTRLQMEHILISKMIATSARQIAMFLVILALVSAAIVAFIIYTLTMDKIREIAVLKLIGTRNRTIAWMILQQALALGLIGFTIGKITSTFAAPYFPKYVLLIPQDSILGFIAVMLICMLASLVAIRMALRIDPAEAIGG